ncbi:hypothetical protein Dda_4521 [Drechslerella dactyloides]|uniref:Uncharacterized protein n=1 Tax=Drechslerella dactyloides TaxID=74499 RepID=A0AAD6J1A2_DREDA|nr:hypothetical protein Dda_4521 [Drechslerella dactyloides]
MRKITHAGRSEERGQDWRNCRSLLQDKPKKLELDVGLRRGSSVVGAMGIAEVVRRPKIDLDARGDNARPPDRLVAISAVSHSRLAATASQAINQVSARQFPTHGHGLLARLVPIPMSCQSVSGRWACNSSSR